MALIRLDKVVVLAAVGMEDRPGGSSLLPCRSRLGEDVVAPYDLGRIELIEVMQELRRSLP